MNFSHESFEMARIVTNIGRITPTPDVDLLRTPIIGPPNQWFGDDISNWLRAAGEFWKTGCSLVAATSYCSLAFFDVCISFHKINPRTCVGLACGPGWCHSYSCR